MRLLQVSIIAAAAIGLSAPTWAGDVPPNTPHFKGKRTKKRATGPAQPDRSELVHRFQSQPEKVERLKKSKPEVDEALVTTESLDLRGGLARGGVRMSARDLPSTVGGSMMLESTSVLTLQTELAAGQVMLVECSWTTYTSTDKDLPLPILVTEQLGRGAAKQATGRTFTMSTESRGFELTILAVQDGLHSFDVTSTYDKPMISTGCEVTL
jgi:hypothetical protein